jgi:hypothetical protein
MGAPPPRALTAAEQFLVLQTNPLTAGTGALGVGSLIWRYVATPSPLGRLYDLRLDFRQGHPPDVFVEHPDLAELADGRELPHVYQQQPTELCLHLPRIHEWSGEMRLDQTIVPWAALWLYYFEEWLVSDDWKGGGEHPRSRVGRRERRSDLRDAA